MGNKVPNDGPSQFEQMLKERRKDKERRFNVVNPQKKYYLSLKQASQRTKLPPELKQCLDEVLAQRIKKQELVTTLSVIATLKHTQIDSNATRSSILQSKHVIVNYDKEKYRETQEEIKSAGWVLAKELKKPYHPFWKLNKAFAQYVGSTLMNSLTALTADYTKKQLIITKLIQEWCTYLEVGCMAPYKKWLLTCVAESKYKKWIHSIIIQEIWGVNQGYLYSMVAMVVNQIKPKLQLSLSLIEYNSSLLTPSFFQIEPKLQIEGHFCQAIYRIAEIQSIYRPQKMLQKFQEVQKSICIDIDQYHRVTEKGHFQEIDSDNILSITSYILCHMSNKIDDIHTHIQVLEIVYTDQVYYNMGVSSYMLSTVVGALQYLQGEEFKIAFLNAIHAKNLQAEGSKNKEQLQNYRVEQGNKAIYNQVKNNDISQQSFIKANSNAATTATNVEDGNKYKSCDFQLSKQKHVSSLIGS